MKQPEQCQEFLDCVENSNAYEEDDKALFKKYYGKEGECWGDWDLIEFCEERCQQFTDQCRAENGEGSEGEGEGEGQ